MNEKRRPQGRNFPPRPAQAAPAEETEGQLEGRNALQEALRSGRTIDKVFIADGDTDRGLQRLAAEAKDAGAVVVSVDRRKLDAMSFTHAHQGVSLWPPPTPILPLTTFWRKPRPVGKRP